jgi:hypothetical protein
MLRRDLRTRLLSKAGLAVAGAAAMMSTLLSPPPPAAADTVYLQVWWVRCEDQSEPFSDEIRLRFNGTFIGGWNDVDGGETHWYYSSFPIPLNRAFSGNTAIDVMESDGGNDIDLIGWVNVSESQVGTGQHEGLSYQIDGRYVVRYEVTANPV